MRSEDAAKHEVWRLFVAVDLPGELKIRLEQITRALQAAGWKARWTNPAATHLTLKFFGYRPVDSVHELRDGLRLTLADERPFELDTAEMGVFPNHRRPRVVWLGVQDRSGSLARIAEAIEGKSRALGIEPEERPFRPHLTIARVRPEAGDAIADVDEQFAKLARFKAIQFAVDHVTLYRSDLQRSGPIYTSIERFDFGTEP